MPFPNLKKKLTVYHILEFVVSFVIVICLTDMICTKCDRHYIQYQIVTTSAFAPFLVMSLIFMGMFLGENFPEKMDMAFSIVIGIMNLVSSVIGFLFISDNSMLLTDNDYYRLLLGSILFIVNSGLFITEFFLMLVRKELLE